MSHEALRERLLDLAYGELAPREARAVEEHAASCEACRAELARIRDTRRTMSALGPERAPEHGERVLLAAARERAEARRARRRVPPWLWGATAAAFSLVAVAAVSYRILAMRPGPRGDDEALVGTSPYASAPPAQAPAPPRAPTLTPRDAAGAEEGEGRAAPASDAARVTASRPPRRGGEGDRVARARGRGDAGGAPEAEATSRFAEPPPAPAADPSLAAGGGAGDRAARAKAAEAPEPSTPEPSGASAAAAAPSAPSAAGEVPAADAERLRPPTLDAPSRAAPAPRARAEAAPSAAPAASPHPALERWEALRDAGALREEARTFLRCEGEEVRRVEWDRQGRLVRYVREGRLDGRRLRIEHLYDAEGRLDVAIVRDLDAPATRLDADALGLSLPASAAEAGLDAPPRCGR